MTWFNDKAKSRAINDGNIIQMPCRSGGSGWNRDVTSDDPESGGCLMQPYIDGIDYGMACLKVNSDEEALAWAEHVYGVKFVLTTTYGDGHPNPSPCKTYNERRELIAHPERAHYIFVRADSALAAKHELKKVS